MTHSDTREPEGLVSVIIPYFERPATIGQAIESVHAQSYENWELIVVDDGSTVPVQRVLGNERLADSRIKVLSLPENSGRPAVPRNHGLQHARGEFVAFLDSDDIWHPDKLAAQIELLEARKTDMVSCRVWAFRQEEEYHRIWSKSFQDAAQRWVPITHQKILLKNCIRSGSSVVLRRTKLGHLRFNDDMDLKAVEDQELWLRIHRDHIDQSLQLIDPLVGYRLDDAQISSSKLFMIGQRSILLRGHKVQGTDLGWRRLFFIMTHIVLSGIQLIQDRLRMWLSA